MSTTPRLPTRWCSSSWRSFFCCVRPACSAARNRSRRVSRNVIGYGIALALLLVAPLVAYPVFLMKGLCFALFACAFNLLLGFTGVLSFGHAAFFGMAGYIAGHTIKDFGFSPELGILAGTRVSAVLGVGHRLVPDRPLGLY